MKYPPAAAAKPTPYFSPDGRQIASVGTLGILFSDDFGGSSIDTTKWSVMSGGYTGIGSGTNVTMTSSVAASALTVNMQTTSLDELWFVSKQIFTGAEDLTVILSKNHSLAENSVFIGLVECDDNGNPLLNPNLAGDFTNRGGLELGLTTNNNGYACEAVADSSSLKASSSLGTASAATTTTQEYCIEFHAEDIICSTQSVDAVTGKATGVARVSTQCPNDGKQYVMLMRFRNASAPAQNTVVVIQRVLVVDGNEMRVEIASGRGDLNAQKAIAVNLAGSSQTFLGSVSLNPTTGAGPTSSFRLTSANTTNGTLVSAGSHLTLGGYAQNTTTATVFLKVYNKATTPTVGTDTPVLTIALPGGTVAGDAPLVCLADIFGAAGFRTGTGLGIGLTVNYADADTTAVAAGAVNLNLIYA